MTRLLAALAALWCFACAVAQTSVHVEPVPVARPEAPPWSAWVVVEAPERGHAWIRCALPLDAPPVIVGPNGILGYRLSAIGDHGALYGIESFGEMLAPLDVAMTPAPRAHTQIARVPFRAPQFGDQVPQAWLHPAVLDDRQALLPHVEIGGVDLGAPRIDLEQTSLAHQRWHLVWSTPTHLIESWALIQMRSPIVDWWWVARTRNVLPQRTTIRITAGEELVLVPDGTRQLAGRAITGDLTLDLAGLDIVRARMLCAYADGHHDQATDDAREAARSGPWAGLADPWRGTWTEAPVVLGSAAMGDQARDWITAHQTGAVVRPWMARTNPNAGGVDAGMGMSWSAPIWIAGRTPDPRVIALVRDTADTWAWRPLHFLEPRTDGLVLPPPAHPTLTMHQQQPWRADGDQLGLTLPESRTAPLRGLDSHDIEHRFAGPLVGALGLTGDPALDLVARSWIAAELHERSMKAGWVQAARGEGRSIATVLELQHVTGAMARETDTYVRTRLTAVRTTSPGSRVPWERPVHVCRISDRGENWMYWVGYEEAQFAWSAWLAGDLELAYLHGRTVATACVWSQGQLQIGYIVRYREGADEGLALAAPGEPNPDLRPGGGALAQWAGCGLMAFIAADHALRASGRQMPVADPYLDVAHRALHDLEAAIGTVGLAEETVARNTALTGALPALVAEPEGR